MSTGPWHVRSPRGRWGPLRDADVREGLRRGRFGPGALAWRRGLPSWQPLVVHFAPLPRRSDTLKLLAGLGGVAILGAVSIGLHLSGLERFGSLRLGMALWGVSLLVLLPLASWLAWRGWRRARRLQPFQPLAAGAQRLGALLVVMLAAGVALAQAITMPMLYPTLLLREGFRDYRIQTLREGDALQVHVSGSIGPGFSQALGQALAAAPDARTVVLSSPGGLVDEALLGAHVLEAAGVTAIARRECDSACVIVLLGAQRRLADWDLALGLHAVSDVHREVEAAAGQEAVQNMAGRAWAFMHARGIPQAVLDEAEGYQANELLPVPAIDLVDAGALHGLTDGGDTEVPVEEGKWRFLQGLYAWRDPHDPVAALMALVRDSRPGLMQRWANPIHEAWSAQAMGQAGALIGQFAGEVYVDALRAADDHAVRAYYRHRLDVMQRLGQEGEWHACQALAEGGRPARADPDGQLVRAQLAAVLALAESAAAQGWEARRLPEDTERDGRALLAGTLHQVAGRNAHDPRQRCEGHLALYAALMAVSPHEAAPLLRWLGGADNG